jgi:hypothetical protein
MPLAGRVPLAASNRGRAGWPLSGLAQGRREAGVCAVPTCHFPRCGTHFGAL